MSEMLYGGRGESVKGLNINMEQSLYSKLLEEKYVPAMFSFLNDEIIIPSVCFFISPFPPVFDDCILSHPPKYTQPTSSLVLSTYSLSLVSLLFCN